MSYRPWLDPPDEPWLPPVWEEEPDETAAPTPPIRRRPGAERNAWLAAADLPALLGPLVAAQDALARLDALTAAAPEPVRRGLIARLAYREAAGWLAAEGAWVHPHDLALRATGLLGRSDAALLAGAPARALPNTVLQSAGRYSTDELPALLAAEEKISLALHLARLLSNLPRRHDALADAASAEAVLGPFGGHGIDPVRLAGWRHAYPGALPPLLAAARASENWMLDGIVDEPAAVQALIVAVLLLAQGNVLHCIFLPFWAAWPVLGQGDGTALPRLRPAAATRFAADARAFWPIVFLVLVREAAQAGLRELERLQAAAAVGRRLTAAASARSQLAAAIDAVLRTPALTAKDLARQLRITLQAAARLLAALVEAKIVTEITGRRSFRAFCAGVR